jgi:UDP-N-acetylmuramate dehydrogenase
MSAGWWGLEFTSGIPGNAGAAVAGNIAAYGQSVADTLVQARLFNLQDGSIVTWQQPDFEFGYRASALHKELNRQLIVIDADFRLSGQPTTKLEYSSALKVAGELGLAADDLAQRRQIIMEARKRSDALLTDIAAGPFTAGSFFKNPMVSPEKIDEIVAHEEFGLSRQQIVTQNQVHGQTSVRVSAAHVLLAAGFQRGQTWGQVRLHPNHILKLENTGQASAREIYQVAQEIIKTVREKLGIDLEPEVRFLGDFS